MPVRAVGERAETAGRDVPGVQLVAPRPLPDRQAAVGGAGRGPAPGAGGAEAPLPGRVARGEGAAQHGAAAPRGTGGGRFAGGWRSERTGER